MLVVDAHLDLAYNALRGREVLRPASEQTPDEEGIPSVGLPDLRHGSVGLICATIFCAPSIDGKPGDLAAPPLSDRTSAIFLLEGADPIRHRSDLHALFHMGVRVVGLAWKRTR